MAAVRIEDTGARLLETAITLFSERGYNGVSMRDLAGAMGMSAAAIYNHYPNKRALYEAAVEAAFDGKAQRLLAALAEEKGPRERLRDFVHAVVSEMSRTPEFTRFINRELLDGDSERLAYLGENVFARVQGPFMALLDTLRPGCDAFLISEMLFGMLKQHHDMVSLHEHLRGIGDPQRSPERIADQALAIVEPYLCGETS
ncbi:MAG: TetR/AcrR family transcriptional regulator [Gammaproteobacteria bacterium]|nr:MAG: TetR/AcrR family transcriptional regulator [Gammaproteobacteria bacterium]